MISIRANSASTDGSDQLSTQQSKENHNMNHPTTSPVGSGSTGITMTLAKSPTRSIGNKSRTSIRSKTSTRSKTSNSAAGGAADHFRIGTTVLSVNTSHQVNSSNSKSKGGNSSYPSSKDPVPSAVDANMNSGLNNITSSATNSNTPHTHNSNSNNNNGNRLIKMNPKDAASPRRNRTISSKSKAYKIYETPTTTQAVSHLEMAIDTASLNSWKEGGATIESNPSVSASLSQSVQSSVGGLQFIETPSNQPHVNGHHGQASSTTSSSLSKHAFDYKQHNNNSGGGRSSSGSGYMQHHPQYHHHPTNAANSISSKSTNSKRSERSKSSHVTDRSSSHHHHNHNHHHPTQNTIHRKSQTYTQTQTQSQSQQPQSKSLGPAKEEQILFEQRLCEEGHGVAVRKIHSNGKSQLRFVKCVSIPKDKLKKMKLAASSYNKNMSNSLPSPGVQATDSSSARSVTSLMGRMNKRKHKSSLYGIGSEDDSPKSQFSKSITGGRSIHTHHTTMTTSLGLDDKMFTKALTWGNKKKVLIPLCKFTSVRKGKTTPRTRRNGCDPSRLLSIVTNDSAHGSLDIEAPTQLDRDKFAKAFSVFLNVPLEDGLVGESVVVKDASSLGQSTFSDRLMSASVASDASSIPTISSYTSAATPQGREYQIGAGGGGGKEDGLLPNLTPSPTSSKDEPKLLESFQSLTDGNGGLLEDNDNSNKKDTSFQEDGDGGSPKKRGSRQSKAVQEPNMFEMDSKLLSKGTPRRHRRKKHDEGDEDGSEVSSLTQGFDQEIVEELHQALQELRAELDASRAEAARAVKVAEQAIQSAESCSSNDWNSTVTHKAAEAAAQAQKRSAEAIAKQRQAEEKLAAEKKSASFWRKQAQIAEEDAGGLQTRLAVAEVERAGITEELEREKRKAASYIQAFKRDNAISESIQRETLANAAEQNKLLEIELDGTRRDLDAKAQEVKLLQDSMEELQNEISNVTKEKNKKKFFGMSSKKNRENSRGRLLLDSQSSSAVSFANYNDEYLNGAGTLNPLHTEQILKVHAEAAEMKKQFELLKRTTMDEMQQLPNQAFVWANAASKALTTSQAEVQMLKDKLAMEMANRRKLLNEVQDLRGNVRVYCRPRPMTSHIALDDGSSPVSIISVPSHEVGLLHREKAHPTEANNPMSFEFDRMFTSNTTQRDIYAEMEELVLSSLDGYNSCLLAFGQNGCGKSHSLIGDFSIVHGQEMDAEPRVEIVDCGMHLLSMQQIFTVSEQRRERFQDTFTLTMVEIHDEKLIDLAAETDIALSCGITSRDNCNSVSHASESKQDKKLEIRTNIDGEIVVQGLVAVPIKTYADVETVWKQALAQRAKRVRNLGKKLRSYEASTSVIVTLQVLSRNSVTGVGTVGKVRFVDLAASDVIPRRGSSSSRSRTTPMDNILAPVGNKVDWKYANRSMTQFADIVNARYQFSRSVPYRNSTLTHLLQDCLESDTKVLLLACVSSDTKDLQNTANTMRLAAKMRKVIVGKATKHTLSFA